MLTTPIGDKRLTTFQCTICNSVCHGKTKLERHQSSHKDLPFQCPYCEQKFEQHYRMKRHINTAHLGKRYFCSCGESYTIKDNMTRHRKQEGCNSNTSVADPVQDEAGNRDEKGPFEAAEEIEEKGFGQTPMCAICYTQHTSCNTDIMCNSCNLAYHTSLGAQFETKGCSFDQLPANTSFGMPSSDLSMNNESQNAFTEGSICQSQMGASQLNAFVSEIFGLPGAGGASPHISCLRCNGLWGSKNCDQISCFTGGESFEGEIFARTEDLFGYYCWSAFDYSWRL